MMMKTKNIFNAIGWPLAILLGTGAVWALPIGGVVPAVALQVGAAPSASAVETNIAVGIAGMAIRISIVAGKDEQ